MNLIATSCSTRRSPALSKISEPPLLICRTTKGLLQRLPPWQGKGAPMWVAVA